MAYGDIMTLAADCKFFTIISAKFDERMVGHPFISCDASGV